MDPRKLTLHLNPAQGIGHVSFERMLTCVMTTNTSVIMVVPGFMLFLRNNDTLAIKRRPAERVKFRVNECDRNVLPEGLCSSQVMCILLEKKKHYPVLLAACLINVELRNQLKARGLLRTDGRSTLIYVYTLKQV